MPVARHADEARHVLGQRHQAGQHAAVRLAVQPECHRVAEIRNERERVQRVDGDGGEDREDLLVEELVRPGAVGVGQLVEVEHDDVLGAQLLVQLGPAALLVDHQRARPLQHRVDLLAGRHAVGARRLDADPALALEAGDAHHEELVDVGRRDRQEAHPLQKRVAVVHRLLEHALVEGEPRQLAVDEPPRRVRVGARRRRRAGARRGVVVREARGPSCFSGHGHARVITRRQ